MVYRTSGVCSSRIIFEVESNVLTKVRYFDGCNGNLLGISKLVEGMMIDDVVEKLSGIKCGNKQTSCPDQLAKALSQYMLEVRG
jgi:uncharacterized protein (TIGR03905 family)